MKINGIYPALLTPFNSDQSINESALKHLINHLLDKGVHGLFAIGTNGEFHTLSFEEKITVARIVIKEVDGRVPVMLGAGSNSTKEAMELAREFEKLGADALSVITPYFIAPSQKELQKYFEDIAYATSIPIFLYNIPSRTGVSIESNTVKNLAKHPNIYGIKDSSGNFELIQSYLIETKDEDFSVFAGTDSLILKTLQAGGHGAIAATANAIPENVVAIFNHWENGRLKEAEEAQQSLQPLRETFSLSTIPASLKKAVELFGIPVGPPRNPTQEVNEETAKKIKKMVESYQTSIKR